MSVTTSVARVTLGAVCSANTHMHSRYYIIGACCKLQGHSCDTFSSHTADLYLPVQVSMRSILLEKWPQKTIKIKSSYIQVAKPDQIWWVGGGGKLQVELEYHTNHLKYSIHRKCN